MAQAGPHPPPPLPTPFMFASNFHHLGKGGVNISQSGASSPKHLFQNEEELQTQRGSLSSDASLAIAARRRLEHGKLVSRGIICYLVWKSKSFKEDVQWRRDINNTQAPFVTQLPEMKLHIEK